MNGDAEFFCIFPPISHAITMAHFCKANELRTKEYFTIFYIQLTHSQHQSPHCIGTKHDRNISLVYLGSKGYNLPALVHCDWAAARTSFAMIAMFLNMLWVSSSLLPAILKTLEFLVKKLPAYLAWLWVITYDHQVLFQFANRYHSLQTVKIVQVNRGKVGLKMEA